MIKREIFCEFQGMIDHPPVPPQSLMQKAASNDGVTIEAWRETWLANIKANHQYLGSFKTHGLGNLFGRLRYQPVIVAGSGPSLKYSIEALKNRNGVPLVSCLHNFHFFEDAGIAPEYYVSLDAGRIAVDEVNAEVGGPGEDHYWELTKGRTLIAFIGSDPELLKRWQGKIYVYNAMIPDLAYQQAADELEVFHTWVSNGGNVLGACLYIAKAIMGAGMVAFIGADFSFGYDRRFHSWQSKYDEKMGNVTHLTDIFGNRVATWPSYANFKAWFDFICYRVPGVWYNCSEGGCLGSYPQGNLSCIRYTTLEDFLTMLNMCDKIKEQCIDPAIEGDAGKTLLF
jgi:hypothetical protein